LKRATEVSAIVFLITSLSLAIISAGRSRSLFEGVGMPAMPTTQQGTPVAGAQGGAAPAQGTFPLDEY
ncbi:MAG: hypothetical protein PHW46_06450, partial [Candidatus Omnitrophica bacterium]|nr:hypothetical protein [Candidatus Omnitrophota bacterium]